MAKRKYEVITTGMTVYGAKFGEIVELDETVGERFEKMRYVKATRKQTADEVEPLLTKDVENDEPVEKPKAPKKANKSKDKK